MPIKSTNYFIGIILDNSYTIESPPMFIIAFCPKDSSMHSMSRIKGTDRPPPILYTRHGAELDPELGEVGSHLTSEWQFTLGLLSYQRVQSRTLKALLLSYKNDQKMPSGGSFL